MEFSPIAASKKAMTTSMMTAKEIAEELVKFVSEEAVQNGEDEDGIGGHDCTEHREDRDTVSELYH